MLFRRRAPAVIVAAICIVVAVSTLSSRDLFSGMTVSVEADQFDAMEAIAQNALRDAENKALGRAELIAEMKTVREHFAAGDREGLLADLSAAFADQKAHFGVDQAQFHSASATSFLRLHDPKTFGDDLRKTRPMIVAANRERQPLKGIAIARNGPSIFGIAMMNDLDGKHVGTFEIGLNIGPLLTSIKSAYNMDLAFYVLETPLRQLAPGLKKDRIGDDKRVGHYISFETTDARLLSALAGPDELAVVNEPKSYVRQVDGRAHGVVVIPVNNALGTTLGLMAITADFEASRAAVRSGSWWQLALGIGSVVLLSIIVVGVIRAFLVRPLEVLTAHYESLRNGAAKPLPSPDSFPKEMAPLVTLLELIRGHRESRARAHNRTS
jgi:methyl-accepting chemotaxis protein